jgi:hypothetical protein
MKHPAPINVIRPGLSRPWRRATALLVALLIAGCGGGGGGGSATDGTATPGVIIETAPAAVTDLTAVSSGDAIVLSFKVENPQNVSAFEAVCSGSGPTVTTRSPSHGSATDTITVTGLTNPQSYTCTVSAINSSGASVASSPVQPQPDTSGGNGTPDAPSTLQMTGAPASVVISFSEASVPDGSAVSSYVGICVGADKTSYSHAVASPITVLGLTAGVPYTCSVSAVNAQGFGTPSVTSVVTPLAKAAAAAGAPVAPTLTAVKSGASSAIVEFNKTGVGTSAVKRRALGSATDSGTLYHATCAKDDSVVSVESTGSPITVPQLMNGEIYSCAVTATTTAGTSEPSASMSVVPSTVPEAPTLTLASAGDRIATLSFTAPAGSPGVPGNGGSAITGYHATCTAGTQTASADVPSAGSVVVGGLVNDQQYTCRVAAVNAVGTGKASAEQAVTPLASTAPAGGTLANAPQNVQATTVDDTAVISFTPVTDSSSPVLDYTATCTAAGSNATSIVSATGTTSPITVSGLAYGVSYNCVVTTRTEAGSGSASPSQPAKPATAVPDAPTLTNATPGNAAITLDFTAGSDGGSAVTAFTATCGDKTGSASASPVTVGGLSNGTIYACSVTATNAIGTSAASGSKSAKPRTVPQPPASVKATAGNTTITLAYTATVHNGGAEIIDYTASCRNGNNVFNATSVSATDTSITVPGLSNDSAYECWVTARNTAGSSAASDPFANATPSASVVETKPDAATNLGTIPGDGTLTVTFDRPASNGAEISYALICSPGSINMSAGQAAQVTAPGTNGTEYTCRIRAMRSLLLFSDSSDVSITPNVLPAAPALGTVVASDGMLTIPFGKPDGNKADVVYGASCAVAGTESSAGTVVLDGATFVASGLTNATAYTCTVSASNSAGKVSSRVTATPAPTPTPDAKPTAPYNISTTYGDASVKLSFSTNNGSGVAYSATCVAGDSFTANANGSLTVKGLTNGNTYANCVVTATNGNGDKATAAVPSFQLPAAPTKPIIYNQTVGDKQVTLAFIPNQSGVTYSATCTNGDSFKQETNGDLTVTGLVTGTTYSDCRVTATNTTTFATSISAAATSFTPQATPTKPVISLAAPGDQQIVLSFSPNSDSNVLYSGRCNNGTSLNKGSDGKVTVTGLANGTAYTCTITALSASNVSVTSAASTSVTPLAAVTLAMPTIADSQVSLPFTTPSTNPSDTLYTASCTNIATNSTVGTGSSGFLSPLKVTGLANGSGYLCGITASKGAGVAKASVVVALPATPGTPSIAQAAPGDRQIVLSFSPNAESNVGYAGRCNGGTSFNKGSDGTVTVTGLTNGTAYTCTVTGTNSSNVSVTSAASASVTPLAPATLGGPIPGDGQVTLSFTKASTNPSDTLYTASCATNETNWSSGTTVGTGSSGLSPLTVTGLANGSAYMCGITASKGAGVAKALGPVVRPSATPGTPSITQAEPGDRQIALSFSPNAESNVSYTGRCNGGTSFNQGSDGKVTVTGLTNGTTAYTCTVTATNSANVSVTSAASTSVTPLAPVTLGTPSVASGQVSLPFTAPSTNPSDTLYTASCATVDTNSPAGTGSSGLSPLKVTGLANGSIYLCGITGSKGAGVAKASVPVVLPTTVPGQPTNVSLTTACSGSQGETANATVSWGLPSPNGTAAVDYFTIVLVLSANGSTTTKTTQNTTGAAAGSIQLTGIGSGTFTAKVSAHNASGDGSVATTNSVVASCWRTEVTE